jgi:hypothetical protein
MSPEPMPTGPAAEGPPTHPALGALAGLLGVWRGTGEGHYPTIASFAYREEVTFGHDGRPVLRYAQRTWRLDNDTPMHVEAGFLRAPVDGTSELLIVQPTGLAEVALLTVRAEGERVVLDGARSEPLRAPSAKDVVDVRRRFELAGDQLRYDLWMTYAGNDDEHHLRAVLQRGRP